MKNYSKESKAPQGPNDDQVQSASCSLECDEVGGETGVGETLGGSRQVVHPQRSVLAFPAKSEKKINQANKTL